MKIKYFFVSLMLLLVFCPRGVSAYNPLYPVGSALNPLQVEVVPDFFGTLSSLRQQYGSDDYSYCYNRGCSGNDTSNPVIQKTCLSYMSYCLQSMQNTNTNSSNIVKCSNGLVLDGKDSCISPVAICTSKYGPNSYFKEKINSQIICDCVPGYKLQGDNCVRKDLDNINTTALDQQCQNKFGQYSRAILNGGGLCECGDGYMWNRDTTECISSVVSLNNDVVVPVDAAKIINDPTKKEVTEKVNLPDKKTIKLEEKTKVNTSTPQVVVKTEAPNKISATPKQPVVLPDMEESKRGPSVFSVIKSFFRSLFKLK